MEKFYVIYIRGVGGGGYRMDEFQDEESLLSFIKKVKEEGEELYRDVVVIYGSEVEFEPAKIVESWRIKKLDGENP